MIDINYQNGRFSVAGSLDILLTEYAALTRLLISELKGISDLETAFDITTMLGNIAVRDLHKGIEGYNQNEIYEQVSVMLDNKLS